MSAEVTVDIPPRRVSGNTGKVKEVVVRFEDGTEQVFPRDFQRNYTEEPCGVYDVKDALNVRDATQALFGTGYEVVKKRAK